MGRGKGLASSQPVRVLLVSSHPVQYVAHLYRRYVVDSQVDVTVAYLSLQGAELYVDPEFGIELVWDISLLDGYVWIHPRNWSPRPGLRGFWGLVNPGLWRVVRKGGFDVVVCYGYRTASFWIAAAAAKLSGAALVFSTDAHGLLPLSGSKLKIPMKRIILPRIFGWGDAVFAPSTRTVAFVQELGMPEKSIFLTPNVVDNEFFSSRAAEVDRRAVRRSWEFPEDAPVTLFVGKLVPWKRPGDVLKAAAMVPGLHVAFAGDGQLRKDLESQARDLGVSERVRFLGFLNQLQMPECYAAADFLVLPSEYEAFGLVVNEAFASGIPVVASEACGAVGDLVIDGETGFVFPVADVIALADRLRRLSTDPHLPQLMGEKARGQIEQWGPDQNVESFVEACLILRERNT